MKPKSVSIRDTLVLTSNDLLLNAFGWPRYLSVVRKNFPSSSIDRVFSAWI